VPAAAVIPAPIAYIKVVAVKKLVVETLGRPQGPLDCETSADASSLWERPRPLIWVGAGPASFTVKKLECLRQAFA
jgi:hypothetical protein